MRYTTPMITSSTPASLAVQSMTEKGSAPNYDSESHNYTFNPAYEADE
jgi:hypothetical protein